jgi:hypothetical protein
VSAKTASATPVPPCKGCGSTNLRATSTAEVTIEYDTPLGVDDFGNLVFAYADTGYGENERWRTWCGDCGRGVRKSLPPVEGESGSAKPDLSASGATS